VTAPTLPRCAAPAEPSRWPTYFVSSADGHAAHVSHVPFLPEHSTLRWATREEVAAEHIDLDLGPVAQLLYVSDIDPATADAVAAIEAIDHALTDYGCDMARVGGEVNGDLADHPGTCVRWDCCLILAARLLAVSC
jgi:hypothetical protein